MTILHWIQHRHTSSATHHDLNKGTPATLGMVMPPVTQLAFANDRVAHFPPVKVMLGS
jgi:hypothetical protein